MLALEKWMHRKPFFFQVSGPQLAMFARDAHEDFQTIRQRRIGSHTFPLPKRLDSWFVLYRQHRKPLQLLRKLFTEFSNYSEQTASLYENTINAYKSIQDGQPVKAPLAREKKALVEQIQNTIRAEIIADIKIDIADHHSRKPNPEARERTLSFLSSVDQDGAFFMLVTAPCWLMYRMPPTRLYWKARKGNFPSLEMLLQLDPLMIHDPYIGKAIQSFRFRNKSCLYRKLMEAPCNESATRVTAQQVKYAMGGFLAALARLSGLKLTAPDIKRLYDAVAKDFDGHLDDQELPVGDTFARAIFRYREEWLKALGSDMKN